MVFVGCKITPTDHQTVLKSVSYLYNHVVKVGLIFGLYTCSKWVIYINTRTTHDRKSRFFSRWGVLIFSRLAGIFEVFLTAFYLFAGARVAGIPICRNYDFKKIDASTVGITPPRTNARANLTARKRPSCKYLIFSKLDILQLCT